MQICSKHVTFHAQKVVSSCKPRKTAECYQTHYLLALQSITIQIEHNIVRSRVVHWVLYRKFSRISADLRFLPSREYYQTKICENFLHINCL